MTEPLLVVGDKNLSSWSLRAWLVLRQAGLAFRELVAPFDDDGWRDSIHAVSPSGRVPVLRDGDVIVWDSLAIAEYAAERWPDAKLWPDAAAVRAHARAVSAEMHAGFASMRRDLSMDVVARTPKDVLSTETQADVRRVHAIWADCRGRFGTGGPFLFGRFSIADAMFAPVAFRMRTYGVAIPDAAARAWCETMLELPAMKEWEQGARAEVAATSQRRRSSPPSPTSAQQAYAVIFSSQRRANDGDDGYDAAAARMEELARDRPGFLGIESARGADGFGITVSYWDSLEAIRAWKDDAEHAAVQARGRQTYYDRYQVRVCTVERGYAFPPKPPERRATTTSESERESERA
jgi:glutathione S-transferase